MFSKHWLEMHIILFCAIDASIRLVGWQLAMFCRQEGMLLQSCLNECSFFKPRIQVNCFLTLTIHSNDTTRFTYLFFFLFLLITHALSGF